MGVRAISFHRWFGSRGWPQGVTETGRNRSINRQKLQRAQLEAELLQPGSVRARVFGRLSHLLKVRAQQTAFDPFGCQQVWDVGAGVFGLLRFRPGQGSRLLCLQNVTAESQAVRLNLSEMDLNAQKLRDLLNEQTFKARTHLSLSLHPYQVMWLTGD